jgi:hypothetical protein
MPKSVQPNTAIYVRSSRRATGSAIFLSVMALSAVAWPATKAESDRAPLAIAIQWDGAPCNPQGTIVATVKNLTDHPIKLPKIAGLGMFSLFVARVRSGDTVTASLGDAFMVPYDWAAVQTTNNVVVQQNGEQAYKLTLGSFAGPPSEQSATDDFARAYSHMTTRGGRVQLVYALGDAASSGWQRGGFFFVDSRLSPLISSNTLECPTAK